MKTKTLFTLLLAALVLSSAVAPPAVVVAAEKHHQHKKHKKHKKHHKKKRAYVPGAVDSSFALGQDFALKYGEEGTLQGEGLKVRFADVLSDSRCPSRVEPDPGSASSASICLYAGYARISVDLSKPGEEPAAVEINTRSSDSEQYGPQEAEYLDYTVRLVRLDPYPQARAATPDEEYAATLRVTRTEDGPPVCDLSTQVSATGVLSALDSTTYQYGTHAITDAKSWMLYALAGAEGVDLDSYVGRLVTVMGQPVAGYQKGEVEGGPPYLKVCRVEG